MFIIRVLHSESSLMQIMKSQPQNTHLKMKISYLQCYSPILSVTPQDERFIYKTEVKLRCCKWSCGVVSEAAVL